MANNVSIIVAVDTQNGIGLNNDMLIYISNDLKRFKAITQEHTVIMGRKTWDSLPNSPLPKRKNIVITNKKGLVLDGAIVVNSIQEAIEQCDTDEEVFVIGGANIYKQFLPFANKIYLTRINKTFKADVFFPELNLNDWIVVNQENIKNDTNAGVEYSFLDLERIKNDRNQN